MITLILFGLSYFKNLINENDREDFELLYYKYRNLMMYEAMRIIGRQAEAEECVSEAFLKIAINSDKIYMKPCPKTANLFVIIVRNIAINRYNKNKRECEYLSKLKRSQSQTDIPFEENRVIGAIKLLKPEYRDILFMRFIYGYSPDEISAILDLKTDTVYKRIQRAKAELEKILRKENII